jgi:hypothetical protein
MLLSLIFTLLCGHAAGIKYLVLHRYMDGACTQPIGFDQLYYWSSRECWADLNRWEAEGSLKHNSIFWTGYDADGVEQCQDIAVGNVQRVYCRAGAPAIYQCKKVPLDTCVPNWLRLDTHKGPLDETGAPVNWIKWRVVDIDPADWYTMMAYPNLGTGGCDRATRFRVVNSDGSISGDEMGFGYSTVTWKPFSPPRLLFRLALPPNTTCVDEPCSDVTCSGTGGCSVPANVNVTVRQHCNWRLARSTFPGRTNFCPDRGYTSFEGCDQRDPFGCPITQPVGTRTLSDCEFYGHLGSQSNQGALYIQPRLTNPFDSRFPLVAPTGSPPPGAPTTPPTPLPPGQTSLAPTPGPTVNMTDRSAATVVSALSSVVVFMAALTISMP